MTEDFSKSKEEEEFRLLFFYFLKIAKKTPPIIGGRPLNAISEEVKIKILVLTFPLYFRKEASL